ncbi:MAG: hypothetical protein M1833_005613 [Piccolia ochrophora]|nr:MAG: hypothetical protein M1833_005613 [Piccolia ochrophora]
MHLTTLLPTIFVASTLAVAMPQHKPRNPSDGHGEPLIIDSGYWITKKLSLYYKETRAREMSIKRNSEDNTCSIEGPEIREDSACACADQTDGTKKCKALVVFAGEGAPTPINATIEWTGKEGDPLVPRATRCFQKSWRGDLVEAPDGFCEGMTAGTEAEVAVALEKFKADGPSPPSALPAGQYKPGTVVGEEIPPMITNSILLDWYSDYMWAEFFSKNARPLKILVFVWRDWSCSFSGKFMEQRACACDKKEGDDRFVCTAKAGFVDVYYPGDPDGEPGPSPPHEFPSKIQFIFQDKEDVKTVEGESNICFREQDGKDVQVDDGACAGFGVTAKPERFYTSQTEKNEKGEAEFLVYIKTSTNEGFRYKKEENGNYVPVRDETQPS